MIPFFFIAEWSPFTEPGEMVKIFLIAVSISDDDALVFGGVLCCVTNVVEEHLKDFFEALRIAQKGFCSF